MEYKFTLKRCLDIERDLGITVTNGVPNIDIYSEEIVDIDHIIRLITTELIKKRDLLQEVKKVKGKEVYKFKKFYTKNDEKIKITQEIKYQYQEVYEAEFKKITKHNLKRQELIEKISSISLIYYMQIIPYFATEDVDEEDFEDWSFEDFKEFEKQFLEGRKSIFQITKKKGDGEKK